MGFHKGVPASLASSATFLVWQDEPVWNYSYADGGVVYLSWTRPYDDSYEITSYTVNVSSDNGSTWSVPGSISFSGTYATVSGLSSGSSYVFRVRAVTGGVLTGRWSGLSSAVVL